MAYNNCSHGTLIYENAKDKKYNYKYVNFLTPNNIQLEKEHMEYT